jgi:hypothetical protein
MRNVEGEKEREERRGEKLQRVSSLSGASTYGEEIFFLRRNISIIIISHFRSLIFSCFLSLALASPCLLVTFQMAESGEKKLRLISLFIHSFLPFMFMF